MVYSTVDGENDLEKETREFADIRNPNLGYITFVVFLHVGCDMLWWYWLTSKLFLYFWYMDESNKDMLVGGLRQCGRQGQFGGEDQGGHR